MNSELGNEKGPVETDSDAIKSDGENEATVVIEDTVVIDTEDDPNIGDMSVEINVDELVAKIESGEGEDAEKVRAVKRRLDEAIEERDDDLDSTYNFNLDDDDL